MIRRWGLWVCAGLLTLSGSAAAQEPLTVGAVLPGSINDAAWNQGAYDGLVEAKEKLGIDFSFAEGVAEPDQLAAMRDYARRGSRIVIGHGGEFQDPADRLASQFPETLFIVSSGSSAHDNVATLNFNYRQLGYVLGVLGARMSKSGTIGWIGATEIIFSTEMVEGYKLGAEAGKPGTQVLVTYMGDWNDVAKGKEAASAQIAQGADVIFPTMDLAATGSLTAAKEAGVYAFGLYYDALPDWPDTVLQSAIMDVKAAMFTFLSDAHAGTASGKNYVYGLETPEALHFGSFGPAVPPELKAEIEKLIEDLAAGRLQL